MGNTQVYALFSLHRYPQGGLSSQGLAIPRNKQPRQERAKGQRQTGQGPAASGPRARGKAGQGQIETVDKNAEQKREKGPRRGNNPSCCNLWVVTCGVEPVGWTASGMETCGMDRQVGWTRQGQRPGGGRKRTQEGRERQKLTVSQRQQQQWCSLLRRCSR